MTGSSNHSRLEQRRSNCQQKTGRGLDPDGYVTCILENPPGECPLPKTCVSPSRLQPTRILNDGDLVREARRSIRNAVPDKDHSQIKQKVTGEMDKGKIRSGKTCRNPLISINKISHEDPSNDVPKVINVGRAEEPPPHPHIDPDVDVSKLGLKQDTLQQSLIIQDLATSRKKLEEENRLLRDQLDRAKDIIRQLQAGRAHEKEDCGKQRGRKKAGSQNLFKAAMATSVLASKQPRKSVWFRTGKTNRHAFRNPGGTPGQKTFSVPVCPGSNGPAQGKGQGRSTPQLSASGVAASPGRHGLEPMIVKPMQIPETLTAGVLEGTVEDKNCPSKAKQKPRSSPTVSNTNEKAGCLRSEIVTCSSGVIDQRPAAAKVLDKKMGQQQQPRSKEENPALVCSSTHSTAYSSSSEPQQV